MYWVLRVRGETLEAVGRLIYEMNWAYLNAYRRFLRRLCGFATFSRHRIRRLQKRAAALQERRHPANHVPTSLSPTASSSGSYIVSCMVARVRVEDGSTMHTG
jgi:hypothetical protein